MKILGLDTFCATLSPKPWKMVKNQFFPSGNPHGRNGKKSSDTKLEYSTPSIHMPKQNALAWKMAELFNFKIFDTFFSKGCHLETIRDRAKRTSPSLRRMSWSMQWRLPRRPSSLDADAIRENAKTAILHVFQGCQKNEKSKVEFCEWAHVPHMRRENMQSLVAIPPRVWAVGRSTQTYKQSRSLRIMVSLALAPDAEAGAARGDPTDKPDGLRHDRLRESLDSLLPDVPDVKKYTANSAGLVRV